MSASIITLKVPTMKPITEVENETGLSYRLLLTLCKENKVAHIKAGRKFLINYEKLIDYLNTGDTECEQVQQVSC